MSYSTVRERSERYGAKWATEHALALPTSIRAYRSGDVGLCTDIPVRVYDRVNNKMRDVTLADVLLHCKAPKADEALKPNGAGQILVREDMYVSHNIVSIIHAVNLALDTAEAAA